MANMCSNDIVFYGDKGYLTELHNHVHRILKSKDNEYNDYTMLAKAYGLDLAEAGWFEYADDELQPDCNEVHTFTLQTETKWVPKEEIFNAICKHYNYDIGYIYKAEETGFGVFVNTDKDGRYFAEKYYVDGDQMEEPLYAETWYEVELCIKEYCHFDEGVLSPDNINEVNRILRNSLPQCNEDTNCIQIYKYEEEFK